MSAPDAVSIDGPSRQDQLNVAFVRLSDSLVTDFDVIELLDFLVQTCVQILGVDSAGLLLTDGWGRLRVVASSSDTMAALELAALQANEGPCVQAFHTGNPVAVTRLADAHSRWPTFATAAIGAGYVSVQALPMRLRSTSIGALNFFHRDFPAITAEDVRVARALADVATIAIIQDSATRKSMVDVEQLQHALHSRVIIEQATGHLAEHGGLNAEDAFAALRTYCRARHLKITQTASDLVARKLSAEQILSSVRI